MTVLFGIEYRLTDGTLIVNATLSAASWEDAYSRAAELNVTVGGVRCAKGVQGDPSTRVDYPEADDFPPCPSYLMNHPNAKKWDMP